MTKKVIRTNFVTLVHKKERLLNRRITQKEISEALNIPPHAVGRWLRDEVRLFDREHIERILEYFDCDIDDLLIIEEVPEPN